MERTCNNCQKQQDCTEFKKLTEEERNELSCKKYEPMAPETYLGIQQEKSRNYMVSLAGVERYFV
jgi:hypothetical protein